MTDPASAEEPATQRSQRQTPPRLNIPPGPPPTHAGWAIATLLFFWPLSFAAFNHAFAVYPLWAGGDADAALYSSARVRKLGQLALWLAGALALLVAVAATAVTVALIANGDRELGGHDRGYGQETQQESHDG